MAPPAADRIYSTSLIWLDLLSISDPVSKLNFFWGTGFRGDLKAEPPTDRKSLRRNDAASRRP